MFHRLASAQAKASGNKKQKEVAGEVIRHIKLEIASLGIKEAVIHQLIAQHFRPAQPKAVNLAPEESAAAPTSGQTRIILCKRFTRGSGLPVAMKRM